MNYSGLAYTLAAVRAGSADEVDLDAASEEIRSAMADLRTLIVEIAPPDLENTGLQVALEALLEPVRRNNVTATLHITGDVNLPVARMALIHRVTQEALRNVVKHAAPTQVTVDVERTNDHVTVRIADDGRGFSPDQLRARRGEGHVGLGLLRTTVSDAGASLQIDSAPGKGTVVVLTTPAG